MRPLITLGLGSLSLLLLVVAVSRSGTSPQPVRQGNPTSARSRQVPAVAPPRKGAAHALPAIPPGQTLHAALPAAVEAEAEADADAGTEARERVAESVSDLELPARLDSLVFDVSPEATELSLLLVRRWAERDPSAAASWTLRLGETVAGRAALEQVAVAWAATDLPAAVDWARALPEGDARQVALVGLAYEAARTQSPLALELAGTLPPTPARDDLLVHAVSQWAGTEGTTAAAWAGEVPDPALRQRLVASVAIVLAEQDAGAAVALAVTGLVAGDEQDRAGVSIVQRWAQYSPQAAASWVADFPDIPAREAAVQNLLSLWTSQDAAAAGRWLEALPAGPLHDAGVAAYARAKAEGPHIPAEGVPAENP